MVQFKFGNIKLSKSAKEAINNKLDTVRTNLEKEYITIAPTPFNINYEIKSNKDMIELFGTKCCINQETIKSQPYKRISDRLLNDLASLPSFERKLLSYITIHLNWNSNVIYIQPEDCTDISADAQYIKRAAAKLVANNYITKTNITNFYIINHNEMFYGDIRKFIERYNIIHENEEVIIDKQGRVVITDSRRKRGL